MIARYISIGAGIVIIALLLWNMSLRTQLATCRNAQLTAIVDAHEAADKKLEEGRAAANAEGERLRLEAADRGKKLDDGLKELAAITKRLNAPRPPVRVMVENEPPVVISPPIASCALSRSALDDLTDFLNRGRAP